MHYFNSFGTYGATSIYATPDILYDGNTMAWFDSDVRYITKDVSDLVSVWIDKSINGNNLLQITGSKQPLWSADGVLFDGVDNTMKCVAFTLEQPEQIYMVFKQITWTDLDIIFDGNTSNTGIFQQRVVTPQVRCYAGSTGTTSPELLLDTWGIARVLFNGVSSELIINNTTTLTDDLGTNDMGGLTIGSNPAGTGGWSHIQVKELIIRKTADTAINEQIIYDYLEDKYSIVTSPDILYDGNTVAWFDSAISITKDGGNLVSAWGDKSGNDNHLLQAGADALKPLWSADGVLFDGINDSMKCVAFTLEQPEQIYLVVKQPTWTDTGKFFDGNTNNVGILQQRTITPNIRCYAGVIGGESSDLAVDTWAIIRVLFSGVDSKLIVDDNTPITGNLGINDLAGFTLGSNGPESGEWGNIEVKEIIIRKIADTISNESVIYNYLKDKYSL